MYPDGQVTIETPEQITMELQPAGIGSRFLALALDTVIQVGIYGVILLLLFWVASYAPAKASGGPPKTWAMAVVILFFFCVYWGYFAIFEILWQGQTPGKRVVGIRVVKDSGRPITAIESIGRNLMRAVDGFAFYLIGTISIGLSRQNKRLGDYVAGTIVIHDKRTSVVKPDWSFDSPAATAFVPELAKITEQDLMLIETFLHRRLDLDPMVRFQTGVRLSELIQNKTGLTRAANQSDEDFLQSVARQVRDQARLRK
jgi:uncharacterized RDD family membrane protein YckC